MYGKKSTINNGTGGFKQSSAFEKSQSIQSQSFSDLSQPQIHALQPKPQKDQEVEELLSMENYQQIYLYRDEKEFLQEEQKEEHKRFNQPPKLYKNHLLEIFLFFSANQIYCKVRQLTKRLANIEENFGSKLKNYQFKIYPPINFNKIPYWLDKLLALSNKVSIVIRPYQVDSKLSLDILSSVAKPFLEFRQFSIEFNCTDRAYQFFAANNSLEQLQQKKFSKRFERNIAPFAKKLIFREVDFSFSSQQNSSKNNQYGQNSQLFGQSMTHQQPNPNTDVLATRVLNGSIIEELEFYRCCNLQSFPFQQFSKSLKRLVIYESKININQNQQIQKQKQQIQSSSNSIFLHIEGLVNTSGVNIDMEQLLGSHLINKQCHYIYTELPFFINLQKENFSRFLTHQASFKDYKQKFTITDIVKIWNLMTPVASVHLKICSLNFKYLDYQKEIDDFQFFSTQEILKHVEEKNKNKFTFLFENGPRKKQFRIMMKSNLPNEEKKAMKITIDLSQPDACLSFI